MDKVKILIIEDENILAKAIKTSLESLGYAVTSIVESGEVAIEKAEEDTPDLVLMDIILKGKMDGVEAAEIIRTRFNIPVIFLTAYADEPTIERAKFTGSHGFLIKPFQARELHSAIQMALYKHRMEKRLYESEEKFRTLVENINNWVWELDENMRYTYCSPQVRQILGYAPEELIGTRPERLWAKIATPKITLGLKNSLQRQAPLIELEVPTLRKDGSEILLEVNGNPIFDKNGRFRGYRGIARDITKRKRIEEELRKSKDKAEEATKLKDKFLSLVSHDLRSPFVSIQGFLKLIMEDKEIPLHPKHVEKLERVRQSTVRMHTMVEELLQVSRLRTGRIELKPSFIDGREIANFALGGLAHLAKDKGIELCNEIPGGTRLFADPILFGQVLQNLLSNAIKFCDQGDKVTFFAATEGKTAIGLKDTGAGIKESFLPNLFKHEVKTSSLGVRGERGAGLGLPLSHDIMIAHEGSLTVQSVEGEGSVFYARLPFVRPRILLVEDDVTTRLLLRRHLRVLDADITEAGNGAEALEMVNGDAPHLIISDLMMPVMDGFELLRRVREDQATQKVPIIVITSDRDMESREKALRMGANDFVAKPVTVEDLAPRARRFVG